MELLFWFAGLLAALLGAPLLPGVINRVKAFFAGRQGPPVLQLYYDLARLMKKQCIRSAGSSWIFRLAPTVSLASLLGMALLLPYAGTSSPFGFSGDMILFLYLAGLGRVCTVLGALDTGSSFEGMGASRECVYAIPAEGVLLTVFCALALLTRRVSLAGMLNALTPSVWSSCATPLILLGLALFFIVLTECCRGPVDDPETHLELTMIHEAMILDNSGPDLAFIHYGAALKLWLLLQLEAMLLLPLLPGGLPVRWASQICCVILGALLTGIIESVTARYRLRKVPQLLTGALVCALLAAALLVFFQGGK